MAEEASPTAEEASPTAEEASPTAEEASPMAGEACPMAEEACPMAGEACPMAGEACPMAGEVCPMAGEGVLVRRGDCPDALRDCEFPITTLTRPAGTLAPSEGERERVRGFVWLHAGRFLNATAQARAGSRVKLSQARGEQLTASSSQLLHCCSFRFTAQSPNSLRRLHTHCTAFIQCMGALYRTPVALSNLLFGFLITSLARGE
jgi:hypothetical protein